MATEQKTFGGYEDDADFGAHPDRYVQLSVPRPVEDVNAALEKFTRVLNAARIECGLPDVYSVISVNVTYPDGKSGSVITSCQFGDQTKAEVLAAWAFGHEQARRQELIANLVGDATRAVHQARRTRPHQKD